MPEQGPGCCDGGPELWAGATTLQDTEGWKELVKAGKILLFDEDRAVVMRYSRVPYLTPPPAPSRFSWQSCGSRGGLQRLGAGYMRSRGCPTWRASSRWTQPRCPTSWSGADALRATTSHLFSGVEDGASKE